MCDLGAEVNRRTPKMLCIGEAPPAGRAVNLGVRSPKGLLPLRGSKLQLRFQIGRNH